MSRNQRISKSQRKFPHNSVPGSWKQEEQSPQMIQPTGDREHRQLRSAGEGVSRDRTEYPRLPDLPLPTISARHRRVPRPVFPEPESSGGAKWQTSASHDSPSYLYKCSMRCGSDWQDGRSRTGCAYLQYLTRCLDSREKDVSIGAHFLRKAAVHSSSLTDKISSEDFIFRDFFIGK